MQGNLKIALVEASDLGKVREWQMEPGTYSNRVSSITNSSRAFLEGECGAYMHCSLFTVHAVDRNWRMGAC